MVAVTANDVERIGQRVRRGVPRFAGAIVSFVAVAVILLLDVRPSSAWSWSSACRWWRSRSSRSSGPLERRERAQRARFGEATAIAADTVAGLRVLRGIGGEEHFLSRFQRGLQRGPAGRGAHRAGPLGPRRAAGRDARAVRRGGHLAGCAAGRGGRAHGRCQLVAFYGYAAFLVLPLRTVTETRTTLDRGARRRRPGRSRCSRSSAP